MLRLSLLTLLLVSTPLFADPLPGTKPLMTEGDLAAQMVAGINKYLSRELVAAPERRKALWKPDHSSLEAYARSVEPQRERLRRILGVVDKRLPVTALELVTTTAAPSLVADGSGYEVHAVRWPVLQGVDAEGLLLQPRGKAVACVIALPDAAWTPEMLAGLAPGVPEKAQFARRLAENGCLVLVPTLINREDTWSGSPRFRMTNQPHREFIYRMAFEMGRHVIGYEIQKVLAAVDWCTRDKDHPPVGVIGYGEGGLLALCSAAIDPRIKGVAVSGYFGPTTELWQEPIYRNVWAMLHEFGPTEMAMLVAPRLLIFECSKGPEISGPRPVREGRSGAAPGRLQAKAPNQLQQEVMAALQPARDSYTQLLQLAKVDDKRILVNDDSPLPGNDTTLSDLLDVLSGQEGTKLKPSGTPPADARKDFDPAPRQRRQFEQLVAYTHGLMREADYRRKDFFWSKVDTASVEKWQKTTAPLRDYFWEEVIGKLPRPTRPMDPRSRQVYDEPRWKGYEVMLDLYPDVFAYGILLVPKDLKEGERRPVVVCQHGLEGRPTDVVNPKIKTPYYHSFGAQLANRGYIVYAPQNPYIGEDKFRVLQRMANPLKLSLFSFIISQHEQTLDWLVGLPFVDKERIGFYGLSYGGKTSMRVPAILERYALSICSGDFNEWIWKNVSLDLPSSYMFTKEYEMYEFNLGDTFNYAEMTGLIAPRPFMVERGHDDGVGIDEWVAYEYSRIRRLYSRLGLPERTTIEFFPGGHIINGQGTFAFLDKHLKWSGGGKASSD